jgi:hypothetical protein
VTTASTGSHPSASAGSVHFDPGNHLGNVANRLNDLGIAPDKYLVQEQFA